MFDEHQIVFKSFLEKRPRGNLTDWIDYRKCCLESLQSDWVRYRSKQKKTKKKMSKRKVSTPPPRKKDVEQSKKRRRKE